VLLFKCRIQVGEQNTKLVNIKTAIVVNRKTVRKKHVGRSFAGFE